MNDSEKNIDSNKVKAKRPERKSGNYIMESSNEGSTVHIIFSMKENVGALADALQIFKVTLKIYNHLNFANFFEN